MKAFQTFNLSLHPQSFLSQAIRDITGRDTGNEFDLDSLLGVEVDLVIKHNEGTDGRIYANVATILRPKTKAEEAEEKRVTDATAKLKANAGRSHVMTARTRAMDSEVTDQDIPF